MSIIAARLKEARLMAKLTQEQLGVLAGIDEASASARMNQYERGRHVPDFSMMVKIGEVLGVPTPYFYAEDSELANLLSLTGIKEPGIVGVMAPAEPTRF